VLSGVLTRTDTGVALAGRSVTLHSRKHGVTAWSTTVKTATTDSTGHYKFTVTPSGSTDYYVEYLANSSTALGTGSSTVTVS